MHSSSVIRCDSYEDYCLLACIALAEQAVPVLERPAGWPVESLAGDLPVRTASIQAHDREAFRGEWSRQDWPARCAWISRGTSDAVSAARILVPEGPAVPMAALFGGAEGHPVQVVADPIPEEILAEAGGTVILVLLAEQASDRLLTGLTRHLRSALLSREPWRRLPRFALLTGRDPASLSWVVAKAILRGLRPRRTDLATEIVRLVPGETGALSLRTRLDPAGGPLSATEDLLEPAAVPGSPPRADLIVVSTHGFDGCANGGGGLVFCGLRSPAPHVDDHAPGALACGRGTTCPRGPHPFPLEKLPTPILMLAACNGLRLADSILRPDYNLGLSFLDGEGTGYVSSLCSSVGSDLATIAFAAALASGRPLGEATAAANASLWCARIEHPVYLALGDPLQRIAAPGAGVEIRSPADGVFSAGCGNLHFAELEISDPEILRAATGARLGWSLMSRTEGEEIYWFQRLENPGLLRLSVFRFPDPLGEIEARPVDPEDLRQQMRGALDGLRGWIELGRLAGVSAWDGNGAEAFHKAEMLCGATAAQLLPRLGFSGSAASSVQQHVGLLDAISDTARDSVLGVILPRLTGTFWPSNLFIPEYHLEKVEDAGCPRCGGYATRKTLLHPLRSNRRRMTVCYRCGTVLDVPAAGELQALDIDAPDVVSRGGELEVRLRLDASSRGPVALNLRLSALGRYPFEPCPSRADWAPGHGDRPFRFTFRIPQDLPPHRSLIKAVAASSREIAFATRMFFVT